MLALAAGGTISWFVGSAAIEAGSDPTGSPPVEQRRQAEESDGASAPKGYVRVGDNSPIGWKLAAVDAGTETIERNRLRRYTFYLDKLDRKCSEGRTEIANVALTAVQTLEGRRGVKMSAYQMLQYMDDAVPPSGSGPVSCPEVAALLATATEPR